MDIIAVGFIELDKFIRIMFINIVGIFTPGASMALLVNNSIIHGRTAGLMTAMGLTIGVVIHLAIIVLGIMSAMNNDSFIEPLKILGCLYLIFLGCSKIKNANKSKTIINKNSKSHIYNAKAILTGFLISVTNPSLLFFFSSIYIIILEKNSILKVLIFYGICITLVTIVCLSTIAVAASYFNLSNKARFLFERTIGIVLIGFGISFYVI